MKNKVFIATSLDGFIADENGGIDWLHSIPNPTNDDMGYSEFMKGVDAIVMGRNTFDIVCGFEGEWPYDKPVFVLSNQLKEVPASLNGKVQLANGSLPLLVNDLQKQGYSSIYVDGGKVINAFLELDLIHELTVTIIPVILGGGIPLFRPQKHRLNFKCISSKIYLDRVVQNTYIRNE